MFALRTGKKDRQGPCVVDLVPEPLTFGTILEKEQCCEGRRVQVSLAEQHGGKQHMCELPG